MPANYSKTDRSTKNWQSYNSHNIASTTTIITESLMIRLGWLWICSVHFINALFVVIC
jgi:hypothetical protein